MGRMFSSLLSKKDTENITKKEIKNDFMITWEHTCSVVNGDNKQDDFDHLLQLTP